MGRQMGTRRLLIDSLHDFVDDVLAVRDEADAVQRVLGLGAARHDPRRLAQL